MHLYLLRHGKAEERSPDHTDPSRRLTLRGEDDIANLARLLAALEVRPDAIFTSPYVRTLQTAQIMADGLQLTDALSVEPTLASGHFDIDGLQELAEANGGKAHLMFVGHEPDLSELVGQLCGAVCEMKPGGLAYITADRIEPGYGVLRWLLPPKLLAPSEVREV